MFAKSKGILRLRVSVGERRRMVKQRPKNNRVIVFTE